MESNQLPKMTPAEMLKAARDFDLSRVVSRYCKEHGETELRAIIIAEEMRRFLVLCAMDKESGYAVRDPVDQMWHTFIIFTKDYFNFCRSLGRAYLHHDPTPDEEKRRDPGAVMDSYARLISDYQAFFGSPPPEDVWPAPHSMPMKGPDCGPDCSYYPPCCNKP